jgi:geranylgeranyl diphosphate synthase type I
MKAMNIIDNASLRFCEGQHTSLEFQERLDITIDGYLNMAKKKTGALISAATQLGALLGGANDEIVNKFGTYGDKIGLAYQIRSDILSLWEPNKIAGREDLVTKKKSFPVVFVFANGDFKLKRELGSIYANRILSMDHVESIQKIAESAGAKEASNEIMHKLENEASVTLNDLHLEPKDLQGLQNVVNLVLGKNGDLQG